MDSTMRSDLLLPHQFFLVYKNDQMTFDLKETLKLDTPYFSHLSDVWASKLIGAFQDLPRFDWE